MWVSDAHRFCFAAVPHNASTSVIDWLRREFPDVRKVGSKHAVGVVPGCEDYLYWCVWRDEFDRLRAMYEKQREDPHKHLSAGACRPRGVIEGWSEWLHLWRTDPHAWTVPAVVATQEEFMEPIPDCMRTFVWYEDLPRSLLALPFVTEDMLKDFPHHNQRREK